MPEELQEAVWYLKGTMNNWTAMSSYALELDDEDKPAGALHQYKITVKLTAGDEFKFNNISNNTWIGFESFENAGAKSNFALNETSSNTRVLTTGKYKFYLKEFANSYYQIYVTEVLPVQSHIKGFGVVELSNNILTLDGVEYPLAGTMNGSDTSKSSFKEISMVEGAEGLVTLTVGNASIAASDYNKSANFVLSDGSLLVMSDGLVFNVAEE